MQEKFVIKAKTAIKRVAAISAGGLMLGATALGAVAAYDLGDYPAPFVADGQWGGLVVVGSNANAADIVGATDIVGRLTQEAVSAVSGTGTTTVTGGVTGKALFGEGIELSRRLNNRKDEAIALSRLGVAERWLGEYAAGTDHSEEAVRIAREMGDPLRLAETLIRAYGTTGGKFAHHAPRAELEEALGLSRQSGDLWGISHALNGLGDLFRELGDYRGARLRYEEALEGFRQLKNKWMILNLSQKNLRKKLELILRI